MTGGGDPDRPTTARPPRDLGTSSTGLEPTVAAALAYLAFWVTGLLFLALERDNRYVRFHAMQAVVGLGGLWAAGLAVWLLAFLVLVVSGTAFRLLVWTANIVWMATAAAWVICLIKAAGGEWWKLPVAGDVAERLAEKGVGSRLLDS